MGDTEIKEGFTFTEQGSMIIYDKIIVSKQGIDIQDWTGWSELTSSPNI